MMTDAQRRAFIESTLDPAERAEAAADTGPTCECGAPLEPYENQPRGRWQAFRCSASSACADTWIDPKTGRRR